MRPMTTKACNADKSLFVARHNAPITYNQVFFQNEVLFVQLDELDELDTITHA